MDPLQTIKVQGEKSESFLYYNSPRAVHSTAGTERSQSFPIPDNFAEVELLQVDGTCLGSVAEVLALGNRRNKPTVHYFIIRTPEATPQIFKAVLIKRVSRSGLSLSLVQHPGLMEYGIKRGSSFFVRNEVLGDIV